MDKMRVLQALRAHYGDHVYLDDIEIVDSRIDIANSQRDLDEDMEPSGIGTWWMEGDVVVTSMRCPYLPVRLDLGGSIA